VLLRTYSTERESKETRHVSLLMITTAKNSQWFGDFLVEDLKSTKLPTPSYIRQKVFTIDSRLIEKPLGSLSKKDTEAVKAILKGYLAI